MFSSKHPIALNIHPTRLPKYRGPASGAYILINGDSISGSTVHLMDKKADAGAIIIQNSVELTPFDTLRSMQSKVYRAEPSLIVEALEKLEHGQNLEIQNEDEASSYPKIRKPADSIIDPNQPLLKLINEIRACDAEDFPAYFIYHGQKINIKLWRDEKGTDHEDSL